MNLPPRGRVAPPRGAFVIFPRGIRFPLARRVRCAALCLVAAAGFFAGGCGEVEPPGKYPFHRDITATVFWIGEVDDRCTTCVSNLKSAWDVRWVEHYGGTDDPRNRSGYHPKGFIPLENPFYVALPYNDIGPRGTRKPEAERIIPWAGERAWGRHESMCKNRWVEIWKGGLVVFAQWQDVGPFLTDDGDYVFGTAPPRNHKNKAAGIDVSPAVRDYLGLKGMDKVDWRFVDEQDVPEGPWRWTVTTSPIRWR